MEMVVSGVSTRKVQYLTTELCGEEFSKSTVSELCKGLDPVVTSWNERPLSKREYPFLIVDALVIKICEDHRVRSCSALLVIGVNQEIRRRERVIRIFPNRESSLRLIGAFLIEYDEKWSEKKYVDMTDYYEWKQTGGQWQTPQTLVTKIPPQEGRNPFFFLNIS